MLSKEAKINIISDVIYDYLKGKNKDKVAKELAEQILQELGEYDE